MSNFSMSDWRAHGDNPALYDRLKAVEGHKDIPWGIILEALADEGCSIRELAMGLCKGRKDIPLSIIR